MVEERNSDGANAPEAGSLARDGDASIAYRRVAGRAPAVVFLGGLRSDMTGTKATWLESHCRAAGRAYVRFDYQGHGASSGVFTAGTIGLWRDDALAVIDRLTEGQVVLIGSSMGGWIALLAALARPGRVAGIIGVAAAPDFTEELMWRRYGPEIRKALFRDGVYHEPSDYGGPTPVTMRLIEEGRSHLLLGRRIPIHCPVRLLHGMRDRTVPWMTASRLAERLLAEDVRVLLFKEGDHRLSSDGELGRLSLVLDELCTEIERKAER